MPDPKLQKKKTNPLFFLLLFVVILAGAYYYYQTFIYTPPAAPELNATLPIKTTGDWNKLYDDPSYTTLENPLPSKVQSGPKGNPEPFVQLSPTEARK